MYPAVYYRLITLLLLGLLSSCSVYNNIFHPHRLGNPPMTASAKAKAKAAEKARHKGLTLGATEATKSDAADGSSPDAGAAPAADTRSEEDKNKAIANMLGNTYDTKTGLLKRSKLQRLQYSRRALHHYDLSAPKHTEATRDERKMRKYSKPTDKGQDAPEPKEPREPAPAPDPTQPAPVAKPTKAAPRKAAAPAEPPAAAEPPVATPAADEPPLAPRSNPGKLKSDKKSKKKYPKGYKPDPTQPQDGN